jgi:hypothetical protein
MTLMQIRLELARTPDFPEGSSAHGYDFVAPLDDDFRIDAKQWAAFKTQCRVTRFWGDEPEERGMLRHVGRGWRFDYDKDSTEDDEPLFKLDRHTLQPGTYVSVTEHDGEQLPFRVAYAVPATKAELSERA